MGAQTVTLLVARDVKVCYRFDMISIRLQRGGRRVFSLSWKVSFCSPAIFLFAFLTKVSFFLLSL